MTVLTIYKNFTFEASHILPRHPGKCSRLHGHSWKLTVGVSGPVNKETGFVLDYAILNELVRVTIIAKCDHQHLGYGSIGVDRLNLPSIMQHPPLGEEFYPSSENLVAAFARILQPLVVELGVQLEEVSLDETCTCKATWRRE